jgi:hypothetical protein
MADERAIAALLDKQAIHEVVLRYCRGIDRRDASLVRDCYWPDATDDHAGAFAGRRDDFVDWVLRVVTRFTGTMHVIANHLVELDAGDLDADVASSEAYGIAHHWGEPPDDPRRNFTTGFRYLDRFERREGEWRIAARTVALEWRHLTLGSPSS